MQKVEISSLNDLNQLARCHIDCFPDTLASVLGMNYVRKRLEWLLVDADRFMLHIRNEQNEIVGYCAVSVLYKVGEGSSSNMFQYAFKEAIVGILQKPHLIFNKEVVKLYPFIFKNIKRKIRHLISKPKPISVITQQNNTPKAGLVVIGIESEYRGTGMFVQLMNEFEKQMIERKQQHVKLSVKQKNARAIAAYEKMGWIKIETLGDTFVMSKSLW